MRKSHMSLSSLMLLGANIPRSVLTLIQKWDLVNRIAVANVSEVGNNLL